MVSVYERRYEIMAKINKYWGFVAVGAVAAAAAVLLHKIPHPEVHLPEDAKVRKTYILQIH